MIQNPSPNMATLPKTAQLQCLSLLKYDSTLAGNHVLDGSLDVITAIRTLAIKVSNKISFSTYQVL